MNRRTGRHTDTGEEKGKATYTRLVKITGVRLRLDAGMLSLRGDQVEALREGLLQFLKRRTSGVAEPLVSLSLDAFPGVWCERRQRCEIRDNISRNGQTSDGR